MKRTLFPYQKKGARALRNMGRGILADDMGLGKTTQSIAAAATKENQSILIVTLNGLQTNWRSEINALMGEQDIEVYDGKQLRGTSRWTIIHYEGAKLPRNLQVIDGKRWDVAIIDEAHRCKNRKTKTKNGNVTNFGMAKKIKSKYLYLLTGTPMKGGPDSIWALLHLIDRKRYSSYWKWAPSYVVYEDGYFGKQMVGYHNLDALSEELSPYMIRRLKSQVIDQLPEKNYHVVKCSLEPRQSVIYQQMLDEFVAELDTDLFMTAPAEVSRIMRLRQIATDPSILSEETCAPGRWLPSGKVTTLYAMAKEAVVEGGEKIIIFTNWSTMVYRLSCLFEKWECGVVTYTGDSTISERNHAVDRFQNDPDTKIFIGTIGAAGTGLTLTAASKMFFTDRAWDQEDNAQAEDRCYARVNDMHGADIYSLVTENTVDELVEQYIAEKGGIVNDVLSKVISGIVAGD